mgnify:CR=1 FL=1
MDTIVIGMGNTKQRKDKSESESRDEEELARSLEEAARILSKIPDEEIVEVIRSSRYER